MSFAYVYLLIFPPFSSTTLLSFSCLLASLPPCLLVLFSLIILLLSFPTPFLLLSSLFLHGPQALHLVLLLHNPRKFHPSFDPVVVALLLRAERQGLRLLVPEKALRLLLPRWATRLRQACEEAAAGAGLFPRGRLDETEADEADEHTCADILSSEPGAVLARVQQHVVTVPPLDHAKYLQLLALGSLFLTPSPSAPASLAARPSPPACRSWLLLETRRCSISQPHN